MQKDMEYKGTLFVSNLRQVGGFLQVAHTNKTDRHDIAVEIGVKHLGCYHYVVPLLIKKLLMEKNGFREIFKF